MQFSIKYFLTVILFFSIISACSDNKEGVYILEKDKTTPEIKYTEAKKLLDEENFEDALVAFQKIEKIHPLSNWALKSKIMIIFIHYLKMDYEIASLDIERFINKYPDYKDIEYAYYLKALIAYEQIKNPALDSSYTNNSLDYFEELIRRFPNSKYSKDARQKIILIKTILAGKDMHVGLYYLNKKEYIAALNRFKKIIDEYETNRYTPEALYRIVEVYYTLGMIDNAKKTASVLGYNYPNSIWYERSYKILTGKDFNAEENKNWHKKILEKIF